MSNKKKSYEKPRLNGIDMLEAGGGGVNTCCKTTTSTCKAAQKTPRGKSNNTAAVS